MGNVLLTNSESNIPTECTSVIEWRYQLYVTVCSLDTKILSLKNMLNTSQNQAGTIAFTLWT